MACLDGNQCCSRTSHTRTTSPHHTPNQTVHGIHTTATTNVVFIVTDVCYPSASDFSSDKGITTIDSVHSTKRAANARAKKLIYDVGNCNVDLDKIIEQVRNGMYTGIGVGGDDTPFDGRCYARKCEVESWTVDEEEESGSVENDMDIG